MTRLHLVVRGRVQGVGFRWFVYDEARERGLSGWVRNLPDGAVELEAEGPEDAVAALVDAVRKGPSHARVDDVKSTVISTREEPGFEIR